MASPLTLVFLQLAYWQSKHFLFCNFAFFSSAKSISKRKITWSHPNLLHYTFRTIPSVLLLEWSLFALFMIKGCLTSQFVLLTVHKHCVQVTLLFSPFLLFCELFRNKGTFSSSLCRWPLPLVFQEMMKRC